MIRVFIDGQPVTVLDGAHLTAALARCGDGCSRLTLEGGRRAPLCGMGICQECRVVVDGVRRLACQTVCVEAMQVSTYEL